MSFDLFRERDGNKERGSMHKRGQYFRKKFSNNSYIQKSYQHNYLNLKYYYWLQNNRCLHETSEVLELLGMEKNQFVPVERVQN